MKNLTKIQLINYPLHQLAINNLLIIHFFEFIKLAKVAIFQVISNVEDDITFFTLTFIKRKI